VDRRQTRCGSASSRPRRELIPNLPKTFFRCNDTVTDIADGFLGAGIGALFLAVWAIAKYTTRRLATRVEQRAYLRSDRP